MVAWPIRQFSDLGVNQWKDTEARGNKLADKLAEEFTLRAGSHKSVFQ